MDGYQTRRQTSHDQRPNSHGASAPQANFPNRMAWFGSLYLGSLSLLVSIGGSMRLLLTYF